MKSLFRAAYLLVSFVILLYLALPNLTFPAPPPDAVQSAEPGDSENVTERRAYFTDYTREQVLAHYQSQFQLRILGKLVPNYRLNYPPEEAQTIIRDQTRSTYLEEIVYPLRESVFVNGFEPQVDKDDIWVKDVHYEEKITVRCVSSSRYLRVLIASAGLLIGYFVLLQIPIAIKSFWTAFKKSKLWSFR